MHPAPHHRFRVLVYSHDTYGLGHARRSLLLAESLAARPEVGPVLVATGSPRAQSFRLPAGVDTLKLPAATKEPGGAYRARTLGVGLDDLVSIRSHLLEAAVQSFHPDLILVDHAPVGMAGELWPVLRKLAAAPRRPRLVLGLRDVIDDPERVRDEWSDLGAWPMLERLYDRVLVYGDPAIPTTAHELDLEGRLGGKVRHVGYLARSAAPAVIDDDRPTIVVTVGGGGDGLPVLEAYAEFLESSPGPRPFRSVVLTGPLLSLRRRHAVTDRLVAADPGVEVHDFLPDPERHFASAAGVVSMAGYNTTCELLAAGVPALLVPRCAPRAEQRLRAERLAAAGALRVAQVDVLTGALGPFIDEAMASRTRPAPVVALDGVARATAEIVGLLTGAEAEERSLRTVVSAQVASEPSGPRIGYVLKKFPRLSETFILNELLALEAAGAEVAVLSTRSPDDEPRHARVEGLCAEVTQLARPRGSELPSLVDRLRRRADPVAADAVLAFLDRLPESARASVLGQGLAVVEEVQRRSLQHLHAHFLTVAAHTAYVAHLVCGVPFSITAHAKDVYRHTVDPEVFSEVASAARALVTVCEANRRHITEHLLRRPARVEVVHNGIPVEEIRGVIGSRDRSLVLAVGRLVEKKGFDVLLDALATPAASRLRCVIVGDGDEREPLAEQIARLGLAGRAALAGPLPSEEVLALMRRAGVLAVPCVTGGDGNRDALPTVVLEAMACGLPVVATPVGGIAEMVSDGVEGRLIPERDPAALASALAATVADGRAWTGMGLAGQRTVAERFDGRVAAARMLEIFTGAPPAPGQLDAGSGIALEAV